MSGFPIAVQSVPVLDDPMKPEIDLVSELTGSVLDFAIMLKRKLFAKQAVSLTEACTSPAKY